MPPVATVITSEPLNVILVFVSASPEILSSCMLPTLVKSESLRSNVPVTSKLPSTVKLPSAVTLAPLNVNAAVGVDPDLITSSPLLLVKLPNVVPSSLSTTSAPPASSVMSPLASTVKAAVATCTNVSATISSCPSVLELI